MFDSWTQFAGAAFLAGLAFYLGASVAGAIENLAWGFYYDGGF